MENAGAQGCSCEECVQGCGNMTGCGGGNIFPWGPAAQQASTTAGHKGHGNRQQAPGLSVLCSEHSAQQLGSLTLGLVSHTHLVRLKGQAAGTVCCPYIPGQS